MKKVYLIIFILSALLVILYNKTSQLELHSLGQLLLPAITEKKEAKILFVGDMQFDRYIRQVADQKGEDFVFSCIKDFLKDFDLVVGNLEGPITDNPSVSMGTEIGSPENYVFTFPPSTAKLLARNNIKLVNLGNNHIGNFGQEGIDLTEKYLSDTGINFFGSPSPWGRGTGRGGPIFRAEINEVNISFISYNEFSLDSPEKVSQKIKEEKENGQTVFVYTHWGDEYSEIPPRVKNIAKLFVDSGADFIVGSHPHIILPSEKINNTFVYYSLGNFVFDQYWNDQVSTGLILEVKIKNGKIETLEHKVSLLRDGQTCLIN